MKVAAAVPALTRTRALVADLYCLHAAPATPRAVSVATANVEPSGIVVLVSASRPLALAPAGESVTRTTIAATTAQSFRMDPSPRPTICPRRRIHGPGTPLLGTGLAPNDVRQVRNG